MKKMRKEGELDMEAIALGRQLEGLEKKEIIEIKTIIRDLGRIWQALSTHGDTPAGMARILESMSRIKHEDSDVARGLTGIDSAFRNLMGLLDGQIRLTIPEQERLKTVLGQPGRRAGVLKGDLRLGEDIKQAIIQQLNKLKAEIEKFREEELNFQTRFNAAMASIRSGNKGEALKAVRVAITAKEAQLRECENLLKVTVVIETSSRREYALLLNLIEALTKKP